jgi:hypothetical protein
LRCGHSAWRISESDGRLVADGELAVPGGDASVLPQQADPAFGLVSARVHFAVETGWPAARRAPGGDGVRPGSVSPGGCAGSAVGAENHDLPGRVRPFGRDAGGPGARAAVRIRIAVITARQSCGKRTGPISTTQRPCVTSTSQTRHPDGTDPAGPDSAATSLSHIISVAILLVTARLRRIGYCALPAMAVGEAGGGGTVIELQKHATRGGPAEVVNVRLLFLACGAYNSPTMPSYDHRKAVHATAVGPFFIRDVRDRRPCPGSRSGRVARSGCFVFTTREVWSVMP